MRWDNFYLNQTSPWHDKPTALLRQHINLLKPGSVLDLGCGDGKNALYLSQHGFKVTAVDGDPTALELLAENEATHEITRICLNLQLSKPQGKWDNVLMLWILHYLTFDRAVEIIKYAQALTSDGGIHVLAVFTDQGELVHEVPGNFYPAEGFVSNLYKNWTQIYYKKMVGGTIRGIEQEREFMVFRKDAVVPSAIGDYRMSKRQSVYK